MAEWAATFRASFREEDGDLRAEFGEVQYIDPHPLPNPYEGPYEVIPTYQEQTLATRRKAMTEDVTVKEIPVVKVTNLGGGYTVQIGG